MTDLSLSLSHPLNVSSMIFNTKTWLLEFFLGVRVVLPSLYGLNNLILKA